MTKRSPRALSILAITMLGAIVVVTIVGLSIWMGRERPGSRSIEDALREFRTGDAGAIESVGPLVQRPQVGVYGATGAGRASIDFPPASQSYGATIPVTVRHQGTDCWSTEVDFNTAYKQIWEYCVTDGVVSELANHTSVRWDLGFTTIEEHTDFTCSPPGAIIRSGERQGEVSDYSCTGTNSSVGGTTASTVEFTMIGAESIVVEGVAVPTFHYREVDRLAGAQRGTTTIDYWYAVESFLLVRVTRAIELRTDSPIGTVTYTEDGSLQLQSLVPAR